MPFILRWPSRIRPGVSDALVSQIDFIASFAALLGQPLPEGQARDSRNMLPAFLGQDPAGLPFMVEEANTLALREGPWKFVLDPQRPDGGELYHLEQDAGETVNLRPRHPDQAARMPP